MINGVELSNIKMQSQLLLLSILALKDTAELNDL